MGAIKVWPYYFVTLIDAGCSEQPFPAPECLKGTITSHGNTSCETLLGCDSQAEIASCLKKVEGLLPLPLGVPALSK